MPREAAILTAEVVLPTPPFWLQNEIILPMKSIYTSEKYTAIIISRTKRECNRFLQKYYTFFKMFHVKPYELSKMFHVKHQIIEVKMFHVKRQIIEVKMFHVKRQIIEVECST